MQGNLFGNVADCFRLEGYEVQRCVRMFAGRMPITATALPGTPGNRTSRRVNAGTGSARESLIFCLIKLRISVLE